MGPSFCLLALSKTGEVPASRLAQEVGVRGATMTGLIDTLAAEGLVRRRPSPEDRRVSLLALTPKGKRLFAKLQQELIDDWRLRLTGVPASTKRAWTTMVHELRMLWVDVPAATGGAA
jgi:DNA-binding MarR family transcriptional regulator